MDVLSSLAIESLYEPLARCAPSPHLGEGWGEGVATKRETKTPHPTPLPTGEGADRVCREARGQISRVLTDYAQPILPRMSANFSLTCCTSSGLARATMGKSLSRSNGRQASMMARELVELALSSSGSSGPLQARRTKSMSLAGSQRVQIAHITSNRSVGLTSSSTTATKRPR